MTGAAGGLGRALSSALAEVGAEVVGIDLPGTEATVTADLTDDDSARRAVDDAVERLGGLDALIGAAGVVDTIHRAETFPLKEFRGDIEANLVAQFTVAQAAFPALREGRRPSIVLFSSVAAETSLPGQAGYAAAKAGCAVLERPLHGVAPEFATREGRAGHRTRYREYLCPSMIECRCGACWLMTTMPSSRRRAFSLSERA